MPTTADFKATPGAGANFATYSISEDAETKIIGRAVLSNSAGTELANSTTPLQVSLANTAANGTAVKVDGSAVTQPVSGTVTANAGSGTLAVSIADGSDTTLGAKTDAKSTATDATSITAMQVLKQISASVQAPPSQAVTNAGTFAAQATLQTQTDTVMVGGVNVKEINAVTPLMGSGNTGTGSLRVTIATDQPALANKLLVTPDSVALPANQSINVSQINAHTTLEGGANGSQAVGGTVATNVAITANPVNLGAQAVSSENAAVTTARQVQLVADLVGKLIVLPYANPENFVSGVTAAMTGTTSTSLIAAPASGLRNYITHVIVTNSHATVGTFVILQDGSGGTTIYEGYAAAVGGGFSITFPTPLRQPTTATALYCADVTTGANVIVSASGYKGA